MRILLLGCDGQLGRALVSPLGGVGEVAAFNRSEVDLVQPAMVRLAIRNLQPDVIVNAAAYTAVDRAESEPDVAMRVNAVSVGAIGEEAARVGARVVHYSTDYVFDGGKAAPYTEEDATGPLNIYGKSKLAGENALLESGATAMILRTSWVYAAAGRNFVHTMLRIGRERSAGEETANELRIVDDQVGAPTSAEDLAAATVTLLQQEWLSRGDVYHATAGGAVSWAGFAREIFKTARLSTRVVPITTSEYPTPAARPRNSRLNCGKLAADYAIEMPDWETSLGRVMAAISSAGA